jgi:hypothetical protein
MTRRTPQPLETGQRCRLGRHHPVCQRPSVRVASGVEEHLPPVRLLSLSFSQGKPVLDEVVPPR